MRLNKISINILVDEEKIPISFTIPNSLTWVGEYTISVFLRDWLKRFNKLNNGIPQEYINMASGNRDLAAEMYKEDIDALADQLAVLFLLCADTAGDKDLCIVCDQLPVLLKVPRKDDDLRCPIQILDREECHRLILFCEFHSLVRDHTTDPDFLPVLHFGHTGFFL